MNEVVAASWQAHGALWKKMEALLPKVSAVGETMAEALKGGHKILICGNGGSAADAQHIAAELVGRFHRERRSLPAIALTTDTSILTSVGNDYAFEDIFSRQVEGLGEKGDVLLAISTSGNSGNVIKAAEQAKNQGLLVMGLAGKDGGKLAPLCDEAIVVPSDVTARIQEMHLLCYHILCQIIDEKDWDA